MLKDLCVPTYLIFWVLLILSFQVSSFDEPIYNVPRLDNITIDGEINDWGNRGLFVQLYAGRYGEIFSPEDLSAYFKLGWHDKGLLVAVIVTDDAAYESQQRWRLWANDAIEMFMANEKGGDDKFQLVIAPGLSKTHPRYQFYDQRKTKALKNVALEATIAREKTVNGYRVEVLLPFSNLQITPTIGRELGFQLYVNDADDERDDKNKASLQWYYLTGTYMNSWAMHKIRLSQIASQAVNVSVKSYQAQDQRFIVVRGDKSLVGQKVIIKSANKIERVLDNDNQMATAKCTIPKTTDQVTPLTVFIEDKLIARIDAFFEKQGEINMKPNRFEKQIRLFERSDKKNPPHKGAIVFVGSSSITGWKTLKKDMAPLKVINRGFGGSLAADALYYVDRIVIPYQPKKIVFYEGDNDIAHGKSPQQFLKDCQDFVKKVHSALPETIIYFLSIKPSPARAHLQNTMQEANALLEAYTVGHDYLEYIDISTAMHDEMGKLRQNIFQADGLHMNTQGYEIWTQIIKKRIE